MPQTSFTLAEMKEMQSGAISEDLQARITEAESFEKVKTLRDSVIATITKNSQECLDNILTKLVIPAGVEEISLQYDLSPETCDFIPRPAGVAVKMIDASAVSNDIIKLVTAAERASANKDKRPMSFIVKILGDSVMQRVTTIRDFDESVKPELDKLYTNVKAVALSEGVNELPPGDKCRLQLKYRYDKERDADNNTTAGWLAPYVTCSKTGGGAKSSGGTGKRRPTIKPPDPYKSWEAYAADRHDDQSSAAQDVFDAQIKKWGADWKSHISPTNALRDAKHEFFMQRQAEVYAEHSVNW